MLTVDFNKSFPGFHLQSRYSTAGGTVLVTGPSGAGKTTMFRCLAGLEAPDSGWIQMENRYLFLSGRVNLPPYMRPVGLMSQEDTLFPHLTVGENIFYALPRLQKKHPFSGLLLNSLGLAGKEDFNPEQLSGGQRRRVMLARVLLQFPRLLLLDEPLTGLDMETAQKVSTLLELYCREYRPLVMIATHSMQELFSWATETLQVRDGIIKHAAPAAGLSLFAGL